MLTLDRVHTTPRKAGTAMQPRLRRAGPGIRTRRRQRAGPAVTALWQGRVCGNTVLEKFLTKYLFLKVLFGVDILNHGDSFTNGDHLRPPCTNGTPHQVRCRQSHILRTVYSNGIRLVNSFPSFHIQILRTVPGAVAHAAVPATCKAEAGRSPEPRSLSPT